MQQQGENKKPLKTALAESDDAVFDLLAALLQEVEDVPEVATESKTVVETETVVETQDELAVKVSEAQPLDKVETVEELSTVVQQETAEQVVIEAEEILPAWTSEPFHCLLFDVEGTEVAVPLVVLESISVWDKEALSIPTQPEWHLGVIKHRDVNIVILDTARLIMPETMTQSPEQRRENHGSHFLVVNHRWGLACNGIKETIQLTPDQVKWRHQRPSRTWAVGTLIDRLCVLMDTDALIREIEEK